MYKLCFFVPKSHVESVKLALFALGAGKIGNYDCCAWQVASTQDYPTTAVTIIATGNRFIGDIEVSGQLQVDGTMEGSICAQDTMTVGAKGQVNGCVKGQLVQIAGRFEGEMWCQDLTIFSGGLVSGKVHCQQMVIEPGGSFLGSFYYGASFSL